MKVSDILEASGISLDDVGKSTNTTRYDGVVIIMFIEYSNSVTSPGTISYNYKVKTVNGAEYKIEEPQRIFEDPGYLVIYNRHGIRLIYIQSGSVGRFNFLVLLISLVSGLVLVNLSTTLVDLVAMRVLPQRQLYSGYKYEKTEDFSDIRDGLIETDSLINKNTRSSAS